jgi:hypothetical protein
MTMNTVSIGYHREDGDFRIVATFNNNDEEFTKHGFLDIVSHFHHQMQDALRDDLGEIPALEILERQDTPDYVHLDDDEVAADAAA